MPNEERGAPVRTKAILVDPANMRVLWMNQPAAEAAAADAESAELTLEAIAPMVDALGVRDAVREVADTGVPAQLQANLVSTAKGSMAMVASVHRLPGGSVLILIENAWQFGRSGEPRQGSSGRTRRRR